MKMLLNVTMIETYQYDPSDITLLMDSGLKQKDPGLLPTRDNIVSISVHSTSV